MFLFSFQDILAELSREELIKLASHTYGNNFKRLQDDLTYIKDAPVSLPETVRKPDYCTCGLCQEMPTAKENKCCKKRHCISRSNVFKNICIDKENLETAIRSLSDTYVFTPYYSNRSMRHAAYRQYVMWKHGHVGARRRIVIPSCCVWSIRKAYPSPIDQYTGFKNDGCVDICE